MPPKRKATSPVRPSPSKKQNTSIDSKDRYDFDHSRIAERYGIINRKFYPPEISNEQCERYNKNEITRPIEELESAIEDTADQRGKKIEVGKCVVHWFKRDLRIYDNRALSQASKIAQEAGVPLICMFLVSTQDYEAHGTSPARVDFELRTLEVLKQDLQEMNIPLYMATIDKRKDVPKHILEKCQEWGANHVCCNIEYEVDELRREAKLVKMCLEKGIDFNPIHDDVVVTPGALMSGSGNQYSVYSPWYRSWVKYIHEHPHVLDEAEAVQPNTDSAKKNFKDLFDVPIPSAPSSKSLSDPDRKRLSNYWPAGEHEAHDRLQRFLKEKINKYKDSRNFPAANSTSLLSVHFSSGTLSARSAVRAARDANTAKKLDGGNAGIVGWISEVGWRDFYKHVMCHWPYVCMGKPFKYEYSDIEWEYDDEAFQRWCNGTTGFPIVDAAMRQMKDMGYVHNRCRMIVGSFLAKDLLIDWRMGEKFFMENLIDADFASNNGGWGFSASTGVDPQPYFRIFNPFLQSEKFDEGGEYIRKWVPELRDVVGKAIHDPYGRGAAKQAEKAGYPKPMVEHKGARERALERYKKGLGRSTANVGGGVHN
jgi:deoxyribodipyrimidine photo-lyase